MIKKAEYIKDYQIKIYFEDGKIRIIDLFNLLSTSNHPLINKFLDMKLFKQFRVEMGTLCWGDNEFDLNPRNIYNGQYDADLGKVQNTPESGSHIKIRRTRTTASPRSL